MRMLPKLLVKTLLLFSCLVAVCHSQTVLDCPLGWIRYGSNCYHFVNYPTHTQMEADVACQHDGAALVSINDINEHNFVRQQIRNYPEKDLDWYTSGMRAISDGSLRWTGDGTDVPQGNYWISTYSERDVTRSDVVIVYRFDSPVNNYNWAWSSGTSSFPYICEISKEETFRMYRKQRDFTYGSDIADPNQIPKGPRFTTEPKNVVVVDKDHDVFIECAASGSPQPSYQWYRNRGTANETRVTKDTNDRYTITNGRLTISQPDRDEGDMGRYQCISSNQFGTIISNPVSIIAGYLNEFSNDKPGSVSAPLYQGTVLNCNTPGFNPTVMFQWYKGNTAHFIRPLLNPHTFISQNGKLYISEVQASDAGEYHCVVTLTAPYGQMLSTSQPPMRTSLGIELVVQGDNANDFGPDIHNDFPDVFPNPPMRGQELRLECLAYGRLPLLYSWTREGGMPPNFRLEDSNRILIIPNARIEDSGNYTCHVRRGRVASDAKSLYLSVFSIPYFLYPLEDQHADENSQLTWRCDVIAKPLATFTWYKNGKPLKAVPNDIEIHRNVLTIRRVRNTHAGMYQCRATNSYGTAYSSAQLRVLSFKPTFEKHPVISSIQGAEGGNVTLVCSPEAAPTPDIQWSKDGGGIGGRGTQLPNGNLLISRLSQSDSGTYTCTATNTLGSASSSGRLVIVGHTTLTSVPSNTEVVVNSTAFLSCQASYDYQRQDLVYIWKFYGRELEIENNFHFIQANSEGVYGLYIRFAQFEHEGEYECVAQTVAEMVSAKAYLTVFGPPEPPAGIFAHSQRNTTVELWWTDSKKNGADIVKYSLEGKTELDDHWKLLLLDIPVAKTAIQNYPTKHGVVVTGLSAGVSYQFRMSAGNTYGYSVYSYPSDKVKIDSAAPNKAPAIVIGGGGTVYVLTIYWAPLPLVDHNGPGLRYNVFWRKTADSTGLWRKVPVSGDTDHLVLSLTPNDYYTQYDVKVQAVNDFGSGPNSTVTAIWSSEDMPVSQVQKVWAQEFNSTAATAYWNPVIDDRLHVKGRVLGYQVNYWYDGQEYNQARFVRHYGQRSQGKIIGLEPDTTYWVNVQVFNTAGLGPRSEDYMIANTFHEAPLLYPEYIYVTSHGPDSVMVRWRGISTGAKEEPLKGYKLRYWKLGQDLRTAKDVVLFKVTTGIITGIERGSIYTLRVLGYSNGGDGNKSPAVLFTLGGQVHIDPTTSEILSGGNIICMSRLLVALSSLVVILGYFL